MSANSNQPGENPRRRIVIPLGAGQRSVSTSRTVSQGRKITPTVLSKRTRLGKVLAILGICVIVGMLPVVGSVFLWWQHYKTTPAYSLALLIDAAQRDDMATVESIIDTDQVVQNFAGEVTDKAASRYGLALGRGAREQIAAMTPRLLPRIREDVSNALTARVKEISTRAERKPFILVALSVPYLVNVAENGDAAKATALVQNQSIEFDMQRAANGWKVVAYRDEALVQRAIDQVIKDLPAVGAGGDGKTSEGHKAIKGLPPLREHPRIP